MAIKAIAATLQHIDLLTEKCRRLQELQREAWGQACHSAAREYREGRIALSEVNDLRTHMKASYGQGFSIVWDSIWPEGLLSAQIALYQRLYAPNGPDGSWFGVFPLEADSVRPIKGQAVVYVLFDAELQVIYVGSSGAFGNRMKSHKGKLAAFWQAYPYRDRQQAYEIEDAALKGRLPILNKKAGR